MDFSFMNAAQKKDLIHQFEVLPGVMEVLPSDVNYLKGMSSTGMFTEKGNRDSYVAVNVMRIVGFLPLHAHSDVVGTISPRACRSGGR